MTSQAYPQKRKLSGKRILAALAILVAAVLVIASAAYFLSRWLTASWEEKNNVIPANGL